MNDGPGGAPSGRHTGREIARRQRWQDGGLASSIVGWDRGRPVATEDDAPEPSRGWLAWTGIGLAAAFALTLAVGMVASVLGVAGGDEPGTTVATDDDTVRGADAELSLAVTDGEVPTAERIAEYRTALDDAADGCEESRGELAEIVRSLSESAVRFDTALSSLEILRALPARSDGSGSATCAETAFEVLTETVG